MPNYNQTLQTNNSSLEEIITQLNNMPDAGGGLDTSDATASAGDILSGKTAYVDGEKITGTIETVPQATPTISINTTTGLITAKATQTAGYVTASTKSATSQLAFKAATTITPGTANQTAVAANTYVGGAITVKGDANLVASNIVSGKSIFGVQGTATAGGGGDTSMEDGLITGQLSIYTNDRVTSIVSCMFYSNVNLTSVNFPVCNIIGSYAFGNCQKLTSVNLPVCNIIGSCAFTNCQKLTSVNFPACSVIHSQAFINCTSLTTVSFPTCSKIGNSAFTNCSKLTNVSFPTCEYIDKYAFYSCASLTAASFPACSYIGSYAFSSCTNLTTVSFPACSYIGSYAFAQCKKLTTVSFPACSYIGSYAFTSCSTLASIYLMWSSVCRLYASNAFSKTGIWSTQGSIFVPASLVESYKTASQWSYFSNRIFGI